MAQTTVKPIKSISAPINWKTWFGVILFFFFVVFFLFLPLLCLFIVSFINLEGQFTFDNIF